MASREVAVKRYVVRLSAEERERLEGLRRKGEIPARRLTKVQILLKADISEAGEGWSDSEIVKALDTTASMVYLDSQAIGRGRSGRGAKPQGAREAACAADLRRGEGGEADRLGVLRSSRGFCALEPAVVGGEGRGAADRRSRQRQHDWPCFKKTSSSPIRGSVG
jgi:hypothetical protein